MNLLRGLKRRAGGALEWRRLRRVGLKGRYRASSGLLMNIHFCAIAKPGDTFRVTCEDVSDWILPEARSRLGQRLPAAFKATLAELRPGPTELLGRLARTRIEAVGGELLVTVLERRSPRGQQS